jgi:hypothetical protein
MDRRWSERVSSPTGAPRRWRAASLAGTSLPPPEGNLAELMRAIAFPNANIIFNVQLKDPGVQTKKTSQARNYEGFIDVSEKRNDACANCHKVYRDKGGTEGSGATRCQAPPEEK